MKHFYLKSILILLFLSVVTWGNVNHEMWRDEMQAWLYARDSKSIPDLLRHLRYEVHPALWHGILFGPAQYISSDPVSLQVINIVFNTLLVWLFVFCSPFSTFTKGLFIFSYYPLCEYGVLAKNYGVGIIFLFLYCVLSNAPRKIPT